MCSMELLGDIKGCLEKSVSKRGCRFSETLSRRDQHEYYYDGVDGDDDDYYDHNYSDYSDYYDDDDCDLPLVASI